MTCSLYKNYFYFRIWFMSMLSAAGQFQDSFISNDGHESTEGSCFFAHRHFELFWHGRIVCAICLPRRLCHKWRKFFFLLFVPFRPANFNWELSNLPEDDCRNLVSIETEFLFQGNNCCNKNNISVTVI